MTEKIIRYFNDYSHKIMRFRISLYMSLLALATMGCQKISYFPTQDSESVFTAAFVDVKSVAYDGRQTFKAGESIDVWNIQTHELKRVELAESNISSDGRHVTFTVGFGSDVSVLAIYPGGWSSDCWPDGDTAPHFDEVNGLRDGIASAVSASGTDRILLFSNLLSCISFSSSKSVSTANCIATLSGNSDEEFATTIVVNPATGAATAHAPAMRKSISTSLAAACTDDIRLWVLPELNLPDGFSLKISNIGGDVVKERIVNVPFSVGAGVFIGIGDIDNTPVTFDIQATSVTYKDGTFAFTPSSDDVYYIVSVDKLENISSCASDAQVTSGIMASYVKKYGDSFAPYTSFEEYMVNEVCCKGASNLVMRGLDADSDYVAMAFVVDEEMNILSGLARLAFHTSSSPELGSYESYLGEWIISGSLVPGNTLSGSSAFEDYTVTISAKENGVNYVVEGLLHPLGLDDQYIALYNEGSVDFPVGVDNPGSKHYKEGAYYLNAHLAGVTNDRYVKSFSFVQEASSTLSVSGVSFIAGEYHVIDAWTEAIDPDPYRMTANFIRVDSIIRLTE